MKENLKGVVGQPGLAVMTPAIVKLLEWLFIQRCHRESRNCLGHVQIINNEIMRYY